MIYHLMKRDPAWEMAPYLAVASAVLWPLLSRPGDEPFKSCLIASVVYMASNLILRVHERCSLSAAALPIEGRQLFLARLLSLLTCIWLPIVAAMAVGHTDATGLIAAAAVSTVAVLCAQSVHVREISAPPWLVTVVGPVLIVGGGLLFYFSAEAMLIVGAVISVI